MPCQTCRSCETTIVTCGGSHLRSNLRKISRRGFRSPERKKSWRSNNAYHRVQLCAMISKNRTTIPPPRVPRLRSPNRRLCELSIVKQYARFNDTSTEDIHPYHGLYTRYAAVAGSLAIRLDPPIGT